MKSLKVLVVDNDPSTCALLQTIFEMENYQTASVNEIEHKDVIALLEREQPDLLILDFHLGGLKTLNCLNSIRNHPDWQAIPILMISAEDRSQECLEAGADDFVLKPFNWQTIIAATKDLLKQ